jgi:hypothetical protein
LTASPKITTLQPWETAVNILSKSILSAKTDGPVRDRRISPPSILELYAPVLEKRKSPSELYVYAPELARHKSTSVREVYAEDNAARLASAFDMGDLKTNTQCSSLSLSLKRSLSAALPALDRQKSPSVREIYAEDNAARLANSFDPGRSLSDKQRRSLSLSLKSFLRLPDHSLKIKTSAKTKFGDAPLG